MYRITGSFLLLLLFISGILQSRAQLAHSPYVDSVVAMTDTSNLVLLVRQLSGDTSVVINGQPHTFTTRYYNNPQNELATEFIIERFEEYGYNPEIQNFNTSGKNVIATKTGTLFPDEYFILCAHYDSYSYASTAIAPGADDNASGTSAVLEAARLFSNIPTLYSIKFIAFDEEEIGLFGSQYFASQAAQSGMIINGVINMDMLGYTSDTNFVYDLCRKDWNSPLSFDFASSVDYYFPRLTTKFSNCSASDHYSFWINNYESVGIGEDHDDFNPYYHTAEDLISNFNLTYYFLLSRSAFSTVLANALGYKYLFSHEPLAPTNSTLPRTAEVIITGVHPVVQGSNSPVLYFSTDNLNYELVLPFESAGDTFSFLIPGFSHGTQVSYYFAVQNEDGSFSMTNPTGGFGLYPPGNVSPPETYGYIIDAIVYKDKCSENTPLPIPVNTVSFDEFIVTDAGRIYDLNVAIDITHKSTEDLKITLTGPDSTSVVLTDALGGTGNNYTQTVFDDEAEISILNGEPPFTGSYQPLEPLATFKNKYTDGKWRLSITEYNPYFTGGLLNSWCLHFIYIDTTVNARMINYDNLFLNTYPNPVKDKLEIELKVNYPLNAEIGMYNLSGRLVKNLNITLQPGRNVVVTPVNELPQGIYFIKVRSHRLFATKKIVILR